MPCLLGTFFCSRHFFSRYCLQFATDDVGGEAGAEEAAVDGSHSLFVDFAAMGTELALDALADHRGFIGLLGRFFQGCVDVPIRDTACSKVPRHAKLSLLPPFCALAGEL